MKKWISVTIVFILGCTLLFSQDLVEAARKEKARRAQLKTKSAIIVTNADLEQFKSEETLRISPSEDQNENLQRSAQPRPQGKTPTKPSQPSIRQPSQQIDNIDQMDLRVDKGDRLDQLQARGFSTDYATQVIDFNELVRNPEWALDKPDGRSAEIPMLGFIDLQISAKNGPGDDIAVFALNAGAESVAPGGEEEGGIPQIVADFYEEGLWYGILGMEKDGDWVAIGKGSGTVSPEKFDLGSLSSVNKVRIMFRQFSNADFPVKFNKTQAYDPIIKIDAIESLHR
jgi:hypothetical protein